MMSQSCVNQMRLCLHLYLHLTPAWPETFPFHVVDIKRSTARSHFNSRNLLTYLSDIIASGVISRGLDGSNRDVKGQAGPKYHKRMKGYEPALTESKDSKGGGGLKCILRVVVVLLWGWWAWLHFCQRSTELKGGPCTNETQFHATLSFPVLFPAFIFIKTRDNHKLIITAECLNAGRAASPPLASVVLHVHACKMLI